MLAEARLTLYEIKSQASSRGHPSTYERRASQQQSRCTRQGLS